MRAKILPYLLVVICLIFDTAIAKADTPFQSGSGGNRLDPNYKWTDEELAKLAAKNKAARSHANQKGLAAATNQAILSVGSAEKYREPNDYAHRNYCGPSSTQVAIRARTSNVPGLETVAVGEYLDPNYGVWINNITNYINGYLGTSWYVTGVANDSTQLGDWAQTDIDTGYAMITGAYTDGMPGWVVSADHIVTVYGYNYSTPTKKKIYYVDTGSEYSGHLYSIGGKYFNTSKSLEKFWVWVNHPDNDVQVW